MCTSIFYSVRVRAPGPSNRETSALRDMYARGSARVGAGTRRRGFTGPRRGIIAAVALGGAVGACLRYEVALSLPSGAGAFPLSTFVINVSGSFVLGVLLTVLAGRWRPSDYVRSLVGSGLIGAYTTWSTFMVEVDQLIQHGHDVTGAAYLVASLSGGLVAVWAGVLTGRARPIGYIRSRYGSALWVGSRRGDSRSRDSQALNAGGRGEH